MEAVGSAMDDVSDMHAGRDMEGGTHEVGSCGGAGQHVAVVLSGEVGFEVVGGGGDIDDVPGAGIFDEVDDDVAAIEDEGVAGLLGLDEPELVLLGLGDDLSVADDADVVDGETEAGGIEVELDVGGGLNHFRAVEAVDVANEAPPGEEVVFLLEPEVG